MTRSDTPKPKAPSLAELMQRYLRDASVLPAAGAGGEVEPFEVTTAFRVDPVLAWSDARAALRFLDLARPAQGAQPPAAWSELVPNPPQVVALPLAAGNFPQAVRDLTPLLQATDLAALRPRAGTAGPAGDVRVSAKMTAVEKILLAGALRLAGDGAGAETLLRSVTDAPPAALANEEAALRWHRGDAEGALRMWEEQGEGVVAAFNRGMALLFTGRPADARGPLATAVKGIPEISGWHHLGRLYLALAEMRG